MQTLSLQTRLATPARLPARASRKSVVPRAGFKESVDSVTKAFLSIFTLPDVDKSTPFQEKGTTAFEGRIKHHGPGKPFKDGYSSGTASTTEAAAQPEATQEGSSAKTYVGEALERVVGHNFTGDKETEPDWEGSGSGWNKDTRTRSSDGFHSKKV